MEMIKKSNKATLIAAALIITGATAIFSVSANEEVAPKMGDKESCPFFQELSEEQKATLEEAHELMQAGDKEAGRALLEEAGIKPPMKRGGIHMRGGMRNMENLSEEQKATLEEAHELMQAGDKEAAKALLDEAGIKRPEMKKFGTREGGMKRFHSNIDK